MRSYDSSQHFVAHVRGQLAKTKALVLPASLRMFKGFGQMDCLINLKGNLQVRVDLLPTKLHQL